MDVLVPGLKVKDPDASSSLTRSRAATSVAASSAVMIPAREALTWALEAGTSSAASRLSKDRLADKGHRLRRGLPEAALPERH